MGLKLALERVDYQGSPVIIRFLAVVENRLFLLKPGWWNWQTRTLEVRMGDRAGSSPAPGTIFIP
jgi:hypothetical protein